MKTLAALFACAVLSAGAEPALTIYNQNFAVVRDSVPLDLKAGANRVVYSGATAQVEPDSVILRDPSGKHSLQILEQNYRNDPVSQELLLSLNEGKTIDFQNLRMKDSTQMPELIPGKIIRSGYVPGGEAQSPIIEVNGKLQFSLPGQPLFPDLGDDTIPVSYTHLGFEQRQPLCYSGRSEQSISTGHSRLRQRFELCRHRRCGCGGKNSGGNRRGVERRRGRGNFGARV